MNNPSVRKSVLHNNVTLQLGIWGHLVIFEAQSAVSVLSNTSQIYATNICLNAPAHPKAHE